ncbi:MAG: YifB family Mg chelatase-like AAA ATPase [Bacteroidetes bacterium]|jgi:magnesium chelatase family protein|nr:YifB family Mg chelatase-like AAA ATPase [Bacteroidota bacterium]MBT3802066.1 YifB family Mg chelatase-like AAA ATPase [Bacteroidota bacterium]MBT4968282.1 YifB family Mg chelatase-like AAA ATPase [Bacteroidota bacterium]MBT5530298.1 YifB family Mg chelatase-like AAA ATPase [Cytophagia bacterium]MBT5990904.1 YifB family Mg chelatase-like AAA ATPase [Bacteroidota bacterium]
MIVKTFGSAVFGVDAQTITIEVDVGRGTKYYLVGLPDNAVKESQQRIEAALKNTGYQLTRKKIIINLAPADIRKEGSAYDLPIAIGIIAASAQIKTHKLNDYILMGELSLDGLLKPIKGALPIAINARKAGFKGLILPKENESEAAIVDNLDVLGIESISDAIDFFNDDKEIIPKKIDTRELFYGNIDNYELDFSDVKGQETIKRALEISAAGNHNAIMIGAPGSGKTMLAKRIPSILPPLDLYEALETTKIYSVAGKMSSESTLMTTRPYRSPHHTVSDVALVGGGNVPQPGEISLSHNGVLFLDELPEFKRTVLEVLRQPMEERKITISRAKFTVDYPASFMLLAAMNPCPCGYYNHPDKDCVCSPGTVQKYLNKISGPLLDRIDLHIEVVPISFDELAHHKAGEESSIIRNRVISAREIQHERFKDFKGIYNNAQMSTQMIHTYCQISDAGNKLLKTAMEKLKLSARAYDRILKVSRTIADLAGVEEIKIEYLAEAIHFRSLDRENWAG